MSARPGGPMGVGATSSSREIRPTASGMYNREREYTNDTSGSNIFGGTVRNKNNFQGSDPRPAFAPLNQTTMVSKITATDRGSIE